MRDRPQADGADTHVTFMPIDSQSVSDVDMTGVDPLRYREVRRRVAVVQSYLRLSDPDIDARRDHAQQLGLSVSQFMGIVRAWREHGRAAGLYGSGTYRGVARPQSARNLPRAAKVAAREVLAELDPGTPLVDAVRMIAERCSAAGVKPPSRSTIWNMMMEGRRGSPASVGTDEIIVSLCHVKVPVEIDGEVIFPAIVVVVDAVDGTILAATTLQVDRPFVTEALRVKAIVGRPVVIDAELARSVSPAPGANWRMVKPSAARTATARVLGRGFGTVDLIYQISRTVRPQEALRARIDMPLTCQDAHGVLLEQLSLHNAGRNAAPPTVSWTYPMP